MKKIFIGLFILLFLCSCHMWPNEQEEVKSPFGWRSAGLQFDDRSVALSQMFHSGNYIFVMDGGIQYLDEYYPNKYIYFTEQGSMVWDTLKLPENVTPSVIYADSNNGLYIGTSATGQVWHYNPNMKTWNSLIKKDNLYIYGITRLNNNLVISMCDTLWNVKENCPILIQQDDGTWEDITPASDILVFTNAREWHNDLFVITSNHKGLWRFNSANKEWSQISINDQPIHTLLPSIEVYKDRLFVGYSSNGVWSLNDDYQTWKCEDFEWINYSHSPIFGWGDVVMRGNPMYVWTLKTNGEYLFSAGYDDITPRLYMGDRGEPMGWRKIGSGSSLCPKPGYRLCSFTYGLDVIGDTLYAAAKTGVYKIPIVELDSAIKNSDPYGRFPDMKPKVDSFPTPWVYKK